MHNPEVSAQGQELGESLPKEEEGFFVCLIFKYGLCQPVCIVRTHLFSFNLGASQVGKESTYQYRRHRRHGLALIPGLGRSRAGRNGNPLQCS